MNAPIAKPAADLSGDPSLSLFQLLDPAVHADPYPFYTSLRERSPVHWDPFMSTWVVTRYEDVHVVLKSFSADRTPDETKMVAMGLPKLGPVADMMSRQMLFMDPPDHTRLKTLCYAAFTPRRVDAMAGEVHTIAARLIDDMIEDGEADFIRDFAEPFPALVAAGLLGVPLGDHRQLKDWSASFAEMLGNFQHNPDRIKNVIKTVGEMQDYFRAEIRAQERRPRDGLIGALMRAEVDGERLAEDEVIANTIVTMVGGQETTTNLMGNGLLTLIRQPDVMADLRANPEIMDSAIEELLRFESPSQHTARIAKQDTVIGGRTIKQGAAVMAIMAAANRDPERFADPDRLDLRRADNRHLAFGWATHFCFGAPLARLEAKTAFTQLLARLHDIRLTVDAASLKWRPNSGLRGLVSLPIAFTGA